MHKQVSSVCEYDTTVLADKRAAKDTHARVQRGQLLVIDSLHINAGTGHDDSVRLWTLRHMSLVAARATHVLHRVCQRASVSACLHGSSSGSYSSMGAQNGIHGDGASAPKPLNQMFAKLPDTIFSVMTSLSIKHNSINLGQGFPDDEGPGDH